MEEGGLLSRTGNNKQVKKELLFDMKEPPVYNTATLGGVPEGGERDHPGNILHLLDGGLEGLPGEVSARRGKPGNQTGPPMYEGLWTAKYPHLVLYGTRAPCTYNRIFPCMELDYPYAIKNQRGAMGVFCIPKAL